MISAQTDDGVPLYGAGMSSMLRFSAVAALVTACSNHASTADANGTAPTVCSIDTDCGSELSGCTIPTCGSDHTCTTVNAPIGDECDDNGGSRCDDTGLCR